ncbi:UNVERIFIED_CONTAM: hypothetical protein HDU68_010639 [Siphonaria sp. JEL0065]|nr:hypothetical protein HDU68_010639 [Siphonaria sp. JEL0065]
MNPTIRESNDPNAAGDVNMGESVFGPDGETTGGFIVAIQPVGPGYVLAQDLPAILNGTHQPSDSSTPEPETACLYRTGGKRAITKQQKHLAAVSKLNALYAGGKPKRKYTRKPKPVLNDSATTVAPGCMHHNCGTPVADKSLPSQSASCPSCVPLPQLQQSPAKTNSALIDSPTIDKQRAAVMSSVAEAK